MKREKEEIRHLPIAFTEHGILQVANVLRSKKVKYISVRITEIFIETRKRILTHESLSVEIDKLRKQVGEHDKEIDLFLEYLEQSKQAELERNQIRSVGFERKDNNGLAVV